MSVFLSLCLMPVSKFALYFSSAVYVFLITCVVFIYIYLSIYASVLLFFFYLSCTTCPSILLYIVGVCSSISLFFIYLYSSILLCVLALVSLYICSCHCLICGLPIDLLYYCLCPVLPVLHLHLCSPLSFINTYQSFYCWGKRLGVITAEVALRYCAYLIKHIKSIPV